MRAILLAACALLLVGCGTKSTDYDQAAAELPAAEADARQAGLIFEGDELQKVMTIDPADDGWREIAPIAKRLPGVGSSIHQKLTSSTPAQELRRLLAPFSGDLDGIVAATAKPRADFKRLWARVDFETRFPEYVYIKNAVRSLGARGRVRAESGDRAGAIRDWKAALRLGSYAGSEPTTIGLLVRIACDKMVLRHIERAVAARPADAALRDSARALVKSEPERLDLGWPLHGEATTLSNLARDPKKWMASLQDTEGDSLSQDLRADIAPKGVRKRTLVDAQRARMLQAYADLFRAARTEEDPTRLILAYREVIADHTRPEDRSFAINQILISFQEQIAVAAASRVAALRRVVALTDVLDFRAKTGRAPERLEQVGKYIDPMDGKPMRYRRDAAGFVLYTIGANLRDDGGAPLSAAGETGDELTRFPPTPPPSSI